MRIVETAGSENQANAIAFLTAQSVTETPFLSACDRVERRRQFAPDVDLLLARQNEDGGWGVDEGCESDSLSTSLALMALKVANINAPAIQSGVNYLTSTQNPDGGWSLAAHEESQVFHTSHALLALDKLRLQFAVTPFQQRAINYLRGKQNADGGYGNTTSGPESTAFETSLALLAISDAGQPLTTTDALAISYLNNTQLSNGSWADDAYSTALAVRALAFPKDTDGDGISDDCETANGLNPTDSSDATLDSDGDGLANLEECRGGCTRPNNPDTDGDMVSDGDEVADGSDPCDSASRNRAPVISSQAVTTARENENYSYQVQATDADNDMLSFTLLRAPAGMTVSKAG